MFKDKTSIADELASSMEKNLINNTASDENREFDKFEQAIEHLNSAAEIFDSVGLYKQAEYTTLLLESFAAKKKKSKTKSSKKKSKIKNKSKNSSTEDLTSEQMVENLKHKGWVFNADDGAHADGCDCSMCMEGHANDMNHASMPEWRLKKREGLKNVQKQFDVVAPNGEVAGTVWLKKENGKWGYDSIGGEGEKSSMETAVQRIRIDYYINQETLASSVKADMNEHFSTNEDSSYEIDHNDIDDLFADDKIMDAARQLKEQGVFNHHENYGDFEDEEY